MNIWVWVQHRGGRIEGVTFGLIAEARRMISECGGEGTVTAVALGSGLESELERLGAYGADRVLYVPGEFLSRYHGELFSKVMFKLVRKYAPSCILMAQCSETQDLSSRLAALMDTALVTRAVDFKIGENGRAVATRPVGNGYLFESLTLDCEPPPIICFLPVVLIAPEPDLREKPEIITEVMNESLGDLKTKVVEVTEADSDAMRIEEADIVVAGGRGMGKGEAFNVIFELAEVLGGLVAGTRPVIDWKLLPFDRQIGQTGKTVAPRLIFTCGVSGANEFTAGMEGSQLVIAMNKDPRARIFRFADLGVIGDVHEILPRLVERLSEIKR